ncbi:hypothetical protein BDV93DRAFT_173986 [Ceratobasidium sp. AG-I]|nr:hypothetical protein BDV93DRAFT_173986 [Ceratobasidium sp. AG-I]
MLDIVIFRSGDRGFTMYPLSIWVDGGVLYDGQRADDAQYEYHCWGWYQTQCSFSNMYSADPPYTMNSTLQNATIHLTFCPEDGPDPADVPPNPDPPGATQVAHETFIIASTESVVPITTFLQVVTSTEVAGAHHANNPGSFTQLSSLPAAVVTSGSTTTSGPIVTSTPTATASSSVFTSNPDGSGASRCPTTTQCVFPMTWLPIEETTTINSGFTTAPPTSPPTILFSTYFNLDTTTIVPVTTVLGQGTLTTSTLVPTPSAPSGGTQTRGQAGVSTSVVTIGQGAAAVTSTIVISQPAGTAHNCSRDLRARTKHDNRRQSAQLHKRRINSDEPANPNRSTNHPTRQLQ